LRATCHLAFTKSLPFDTLFAEPGMTPAATTLLEMDFPMKYVAHAKLLARLTLALAFVVLSAASAHADAINFLDLGSQQVPSLDVGGVTISGSNTLVIDSNHGLSVLGGIPGFSYGDGTIDPTESVTFHFDSGPATDIVLSTRLGGEFGNLPISAQGESIIAAFNQAGQSLGIVDLTPSPLPSASFDISAAFSNQPISSFRLEPAGDAINGAFVSLAGLNYNSVPEPCTLLGWGLGTLVALGYGWRRRPNSR
jgi:hypothetical protein